MLWMPEPKCTPARASSSSTTAAWANVPPPPPLLRHKLFVNELTNRVAEHLHVVARPGRLVRSGGHYSLSPITTAATNPGAGDKLSMRHPQQSPGVSSTRRIFAGLPGVSDTSNRSSG